MNIQLTAISHLIPVLQVAIGPVILISGVGLLILSMTNRYGRVIDRSRILSINLSQASGAARALIEGQLDIMWQRARQIRNAIAFAALSALFASIMIIVLFLIALLELEAALLVISIFVACLGCLIVSLILFINDINRSLKAMKLEVHASRAAKSQ
jgi:hypothetical protein